MTARSVHWQDGMFMWPHHMQQEQLLLQERMALGHRWDAHYNWGLRRIDWDADALTSGRLQIQRLQARLRDGTLVDVPSDCRLPTLDLNEIMVGKDETTVFLALPVRHANRANVMAAHSPDATHAGPVDTRYIVEEVDTPDENTGLDAQPLAFRSLNVTLLPDAEDLAGYDVLPIARFRKSSAGAIQLDVNYIPPLLACDAWQPLSIAVLQAMYHHYSQRADDRAGKVISRRITFETNRPGDQELLGRLMVLNEATAVLNTIAFAEGIHPFMAYLELCRLVGQLAIFKPARRSPKLPLYNHDDLGACFYTVRRILDEMDQELINFEEQGFIGVAKRMQVTMQPKWLEPAWQMFVGVMSPLPQAEVVRLLTKSGLLDMKIGSGERVDEIFARGIKGLEFTHAADPPRVLPAMPGLTYFRVNREAQQSEWAFVLRSLTLAIRVNENRLVLGPAGDIQGQISLSLKQQGAQPATTMRFSLFLVPGETKNA
ncbi:MAG: type VI secretion system baseplate subunit TssK [Planctomycetes bacterium]|nr:type VI secretion system baseplate subunit TssK [Planctomycetota bacterium]